MNNDISNKNQLSLGLVQYAKNEVRETVKIKTPEVQNNSTSNNEINTKEITLTPTVALLKEISEQIKQLPIVDSDKVAMVKTKLLANSLDFQNKSTREAASLRIADKLYPKPFNLQRGKYESRSAEPTVVGDAVETSI